MTRYVVGFAFDRVGQVALIEKKRPEWQRGLLNGVGGHVEPGESSILAMHREFEEETGLRVDEWERLFILHEPDAEITFYRTQLDSLDGIESKTDELVGVFYHYDLFYGDVVPHLRWILPFAAYEGEHYIPFDLQVLRSSNVR